MSKPVKFILFFILLTVLLAALLVTAVFLLFYPITAVQAQALPAGSQFSETTGSIQADSHSSGIGYISGKIGYPSERIPALKIIAFRMDTNEPMYFSMQTKENQASFLLQVDPGIYHVVAYYQDLAGGYTQAVLCGLTVNCNDHSLVPVTVKTNRTVRRVDLLDWYAPADTFPALPDGSPGIQYGTITGRLRFPSEMNPTMTIYAFKVGQLGTYYVIHTKENQIIYQFDRIEPGEYYLVAYFQDRPGGYTSAVQCGLSNDCTDHSLVPVKVKADETVRGVNIEDWYAPEDVFPKRPNSQMVCKAQHTVQQGDTLFKIGQRYDIDWPSVAKANRLEDPNLIFPGQQLCIPSQSLPVTEPQFGKVPLIDIVSVVKGETVTIRTTNFPANKTFVVTMGKPGTQGVAGIKVTETNSGNGGTFTVSYTIPADLRGEAAIAIRLESKSGYYSYSWFNNQ
jgi:LysM repeat protein